MTKSKDIVWVSHAMMAAGMTKSFIHDVYLENAERAIDTARRNQEGVPFPADRFPKEMFGKYPDKKHKKQPDIFNAGGFWTVSSVFADVLGQFNLGQTSLYPTKLFQFDRVTLVEGEYFCLNFGETKDAFESAHSPNARKPYPTQDIWRLPLDVKHDDIAVNETALEGVDLWIEPRVTRAFFLSSGLVEALREAKVTRRLGLSRCRVVSVG